MGGSGRAVGVPSSKGWAFPSRSFAGGVALPLEGREVDGGGV